MRLKKIIFIGHAHIDPIWLWNWKEGLNEVLKTFTSMVNLLRESEACFDASSTIFYEWVEKTNSSLLENIKELVNEGKWGLVGGWIVEPDCNIPWGESFVRHALYGQKTFEKIFGRKTTAGFNPDSFGHNGMLPQILSKAGLKYYAFKRPGPHEKCLPSPIFWWEAPDGSRILTYRLPSTYGAVKDHIRKVVDELVKKYGDVFEVLAIYIGKGDHGGGPTEEDIRIAKEACEKHGIKAVFGTLEDFFKEVKNLKDIPVVRDELQYHAVGCYSVVRMVKELNRKCEHWLLAAEKMATLAYLLMGKDYDTSVFEEAWKKVLFNQFHDVLAGTSIKEAYDSDVRDRFQYALAVADENLTISIKFLENLIKVEDDNSFIVWNPTSYTYKLPVEVEVPLYNLNPNETVLIDPEKGEIPFTKLPIKSKTGVRRLHLVFPGEIPAMGYKLYRLKSGKQKNIGTLRALENSISNESIKLELTDNGINLYYKGLKIVEDGFKPFIIRDETDTWTHEVDRYPSEGEEAELVKKYCEVNGGRAEAIVEWKYDNSHIKTCFYLYPEQEYVDYRVKVDWHEKRKLLKLLLPLSFKFDGVEVEIPYGWIKREDPEVERPVQRWVNITASDGKTGLVVINSVVTSYDYRENMLRITLLRSPPYAHHIPYKIEEGEEFDATDQGLHDYRFLLVPYTNSIRKDVIVGYATTLNTPIVAVPTFVHNGKLPESYSFIKVKPLNVCLEVLKKAEKNNGIVLRLYETCGQEVEATVTIEGRDLKFIMKPFEIKTIHLNPKDYSYREVNLLEE